jgi:hypothetical protein
MTTVTNERTLRRLTVAMLFLALAAPAGAQAPGDWQRMAAALQPGTRIELHLTDGTRVQGTLVVQDADALVVNPRTRIPVAPWRVGYSEIQSLDVKPKGTLTPGTKVLIGIGTGAGVAFLTLLLLFATIAD